MAGLKVGELVFSILALKVHKLSHNWLQFTSQLKLFDLQENKFTKPHMFFNSFIEIQITYHVTHPWKIFISVVFGISRVVQPSAQSILGYFNHPPK